MTGVKKGVLKQNEINGALLGPRKQKFKNCTKSDY